jgi:hypothetical protein
MLADWALAVLGAAQTILVLLEAAVARRRSLTPSFGTGVAMGTTLLIASGIAALSSLPTAITDEG